MDEKNIAILMADHCTRKEAERHLQRGTSVYSPEGFVEDFVMACDYPEEVLEEYGCKTPDQLLERCKAGNLFADCISCVEYDGEKYVIAYCL